MSGCCYVDRGGETGGALGGGGRVLVERVDGSSEFLLDMKREDEQAVAGRNPELRPLSRGVVGSYTLRPISGGCRQAYAASVVCLLPLIFGQYIGWTSPVQHLLEKDNSPVGRLTGDEVSWLASLLFIGGLFGTLLWGRLADWWGRKTACYLAALPAAIGWALASFTSSRHLLLLSRFCGGLAGSGALVLAPIYVGEVVQDRLRGALGSLVVLAFNMGVLVSYLIGAALPYWSFNYVCLAGPVIFVVLFFWLPETPYYLWTKGRKDQAEKAILWLRRGNVRCLQEETLEFACRKKVEKVCCKSLFNTRGKRRGMLIGLGLFTWQQFCGILAILSYTSFVFHKSGSSITPERATIIVGIIQLFASFLSSIIVERSGRKILLLISYMFMGLALTAIGFYFYFEKLGWKVNKFSWVPVTSLSLHVLTYALGAGPLPYVVMSETLPPEIRSLATSTIIFWGTLLAFVSVKIFPILVQYTQLYGCFWFFSIFCYIGFLFTWSIVPETKGIPIQNILSRLNGETLNGV